MKAEVLMALAIPENILVIFGINLMNLRIRKTLNSLNTNKKDTSGMVMNNSNKDGIEIATNMKSNLFQPSFI